MKQVRIHRKLLAAVLVLALLAGTAWYGHPVDIYGLGLGELDTIDIRISFADPGQGDEDARSLGARAGDPLWRGALAELEALRFRRSLSGLIWERLGGRSPQEALGTDAHIVVLLTDRTGRQMMLQAGACRPRYTSLRTGHDLPAALSGGEEAAQALAGRLWALMEDA